MKRKLLVAVPLLLVVGVLAWVFRPKHETLGEGFISERSVTLWSSVAQVREPLDTLHYGDRVEVISRRNDNAKIRTAGGAVGWIDNRLLMEPALWQRSARLLTEAQALPVQARGRTKVATNLRVQPGRTQPRLYQFGRGIPVEVVGRAVADWAQVSDEKESATDSQEPKKKSGFSFERSPLARRARRMSALLKPPRPHSPVIRRLPLPDGSLAVSSSSSCPMRCAKAPPPRTCEQWVGSN